MYAIFSTIYTINFKKNHQNVSEANNTKTMAFVKEQLLKLLKEGCERTGLLKFQCIL
jgi:hypothetical protein